MKDREAPGGRKVITGTEKFDRDEQERGNQENEEKFGILYFLEMR